jgi:hypothetical protein
MESDVSADFEAIIADINKLVDLFDTHQIDRLDEPAVVTADTVTNTLRPSSTGSTRLASASRPLFSYISGHLAVNSRNDVAQARHSELQKRPLPASGCCGPAWRPGLVPWTWKRLIEQSDWPASMPSPCAGRK